jgi:hypothetical protein
VFLEGKKDRIEVGEGNRKGFVKVRRGIKEEKAEEERRSTKRYPSTKKEGRSRD